MDLALVVLIGISLVLNGLLLYFFWQREQKAGEPKEGMVLLQQQLQELTRTMDERMNESNKTIQGSMQKQLSESTRIVKEVTEGLTKLDETNKQVVSFTDQLQSLQDILKNPKQRGVLGEYYLETLLKNVLPPGSYTMQYSFPNGEIVDAAVFVKDKVIPVDSKFSLENYNRLTEEQDPNEKKKLEKVFENDLKERIIETSKYIRPEDGTMDFAFMFVPHEAIYYDLLTGKAGGAEENLIQRAASKYKVVVVSPTSFLAYLQTVLQALREMQIEQEAKDIIKRVDELGKHLNKYSEFHGKLGNTLGTAINHYNAAGKEFKKVDKDVLRITGSGIEVEVPELEKPQEVK